MLHEPEAGEPTTCDLCGRAVFEVDGGTRAVALEVERWPEDGHSDYVYGLFCTQEHAAEWLRQPLPASEPAVLRSSSVRDRLVWVSFVGGLVWLVALAGLGAYAFVRLLGGWD